MSRIKTDLEVLTDELIVKILKPNLINSGYYGAALHAVDNLKRDVRDLHVLIDWLRGMHVEQHDPGPMNLCDDPACRMADAL